MDVVVDPRQQHGLVAQRDAGAGQPVAGVRQFLGDLVRMVDVDVQPQRVEPLQHIAQLLGDAHGHEDRHARPDAHDLDVRDLTQAGQDLFQDLGGQHQRVTAGEQHVAHLRRAPQVLELHLEFLAVKVCPWVTHDARTCAVAAVRGALRRHQHQYPVRVAMHQARHRRVLVLRQRILHQP